MDGKTMNVTDVISGALAECYLTIDSVRYNFLQLKKFSAEFKKNKNAIKMLGKTGESSKAAGWSGTFSGTAYYNQSIMREAMYRYKETGQDVYFEIQVTNEDETSTIGRQTVVLKGCNLDGGILAAFDVDSSALEEDISGTFDDFEIPEKFSLVAGMQ